MAPAEAREQTLNALASVIRNALRTINPRDKVTLEMLRRSAFMPFQLPFVWQQLPQYQGLASVLDDDPQLREELLKPWDPNEASQPSRLAMLDGYLTGLFADYVAANRGRSSWNKAVFRRLGRRFMGSVLHREGRVTIWAPVHGLNVTGFARPLALGDAVLAKPDRTERYELSEPAYPNSPTIRELHSPPHFFLRVTAKPKLRSVGNFPEETQGLEDCVTAIRLVTGSFAHIKYTIALAELGYARVGPRRLGIHQAQPPGFNPAGSSVSVDQFRHVRERLRQIPLLRARFPVGLGRFWRLPHRLELDDRLIDSVIGLESLLLAGERFEATFKFSVRGAYLLGTTNIERSTWQSKLTKLYAARSTVGHGGASELSATEQRVAAEAPMILGRILRVVGDASTERRSWDEWVKTLPYPSAERPAGSARNKRAH